MNRISGQSKNRHRGLIIMILSMTVILFGCLETEESDYERQARIANEAIQKYLEENEIEAQTSASGVSYLILDENSGGEKVKENQIVSIVYKMSLLSGTPIETHADTLNPVKFSNSYQSLIPLGLNYEIGKMRVGETFRFYLPAYLAFNKYSHPELFGAYSNFIMDVKVVALQSEDQQLHREHELIEEYLFSQDITEAEKRQSGLYYIETSTGTGNNPGGLSQVKLHYTRKYLDGTIIKTTVGDDPLVVSLGQNLLVKGFEEGVKLMKKGGKATLIMPSKIGFGKSVQVIPQVVRQDWVEDETISPDVLPYHPVIYEVELLEIM